MTWGAKTVVARSAAASLIALAALAASTAGNAEERPLFISLGCETAANGSFDFRNALQNRLGPSSEPDRLRIDFRQVALTVPNAGQCRGEAVVFERVRSQKAVMRRHA